MNTNYSKMSNEELLKLAGLNPQDYSQKSDEELLKIAGLEHEDIKRTPGKAVLRQIGRLGRSAATGIASIADIPNLAAMGFHAAGLKEEPIFYEPIGGRVQEKIDELTHGKLRPENKAEEYADIIGEGLAPLALAPLTGGASLTAHAARSAAKGLSKGAAKKVAQKIATKGSNPYALTGSNVAGSVGSSAAIKTYADESEDPGVVGSLLAAMAGGVGARTALKTLKNPKNAIAKGVGKVTGFSPEKYAEQSALGLPMSISTVAKSNLPSYLEMVAAKTPGSMGVLENFYKNREAAIARNLGISKAHDLESAVKDPDKYLAKWGAERYHKKISNEYEKLNEVFKPFEDQAIKNKELVDISSVVNDLLEERGKFVDPVATFDKTKRGRLLKDLTEVVEVPENKELKDLHDKANSIRHQLTKEHYQEAVIERILKMEGLNDLPPLKAETKLEMAKLGLSDINERREQALQASIATQTPLGGSTPASRESSKIHSLLSKARHNFIETKGLKKEAQAAKEARKLWANYRDEDRGMAKYVSRITGAENDAAAFNKLSTVDPSYFKVVREGLPKEQRPKLAEAFIADLGARQGRFNINTVHTQFSNLEEPVREEFLKSLRNKDTQEKFLGTMKFIGNHKEEIAKLINSSNTGHTNAFIKLIKDYGAAGAAVATGLKFAAFAPLIATYVSAKYGAKVWTNQNFLRRMNNVFDASSPSKLDSSLDLLLKAANTVGRSTNEINKKHKKKNPKITIYNTPTGAPPPWS